MPLQEIKYDDCIHIVDEVGRIYYIIDAETGELTYIDPAVEIIDAANERVSC